MSDEGARQCAVPLPETDQRYLFGRRDRQQRGLGLDACRGIGQPRFRVQLHAVEIGLRAHHQRELGLVRPEGSTAEQQYGNAPHNLHLTAVALPMYRSARKVPDTIAPMRGNEKIISLLNEALKA